MICKAFENVWQASPLKFNQYSAIRVVMLSCCFKSHNYTFPSFYINNGTICIYCWLEEPAYSCITNRPMLCCAAISISKTIIGISYHCHTIYSVFINFSQSRKVLKKLDLEKCQNIATLVSKTKTLFANISLQSVLAIRSNYLSSNLSANILQ